MIGIYKITSPSGRVYIGQSWNIVHRHRCYRLYNAPKQRILDASFNKYGFDSHEIKILHELPIDVTQDVMDRYEQLYIDTYKEAGVQLMNIRGAGSRGKWGEETKKIMSEKMKGRKMPEHVLQMLRTQNIGRPQTDEMRRKNSEWQKKKKLTPEHKEKIRQSLLGHKPSDATRKLWSEQRTGKKRKPV